MAASAEFARTASGIHPDPLFSYALPAEYYYDPAVFEREKREIWFKTWQLVGYQHQLAEPGDYVTGEILDQKVLVTRGKDGNLHAFYNVCMHRGHVLAQGRGNKNIFTCPFHAWSYDAAGALKAAGNAENVAGFRLEDFSLSPVRVEPFLNMVFVNLDPDAPPLAPLVEDLGRDILDNVPRFDRLKLGRTDPYNIDANWKFVPEQNECYHCPSLHPQAMGTDQAYMEPSWETAEHDYWTKHIVRTKRGVTAEQMPYEFRDDDDLKDVAHLVHVAQPDLPGPPRRQQFQGHPGDADRSGDHLPDHRQLLRQRSADLVGHRVHEQLPRLDPAPGHPGHGEAAARRQMPRLPPGPADVRRRHLVALGSTGPISSTT